MLFFPKKFKKISYLETNEQTFKTFITFLRPSCMQFFNFVMNSHFNLTLNQDKSKCWGTYVSNLPLSIVSSLAIRV